MDNKPLSLRAFHEAIHLSLASKVTMYFLSLLCVSCVFCRVVIRSIVIYLQSGDVQEAHFHTAARKEVDENGCGQPWIAVMKTKLQTLVIWMFMNVIYGSLALKFLLKKCTTSGLWDTAFEFVFVTALVSTND